MAYTVAMLLNNYGKSKEPFWQQSYTDLLTFVIPLRRLTDGYTTFAEVYRYVLDESRSFATSARFPADLDTPMEVVIVPVEDYHLLGLQRSWLHWFEEDAGHMAHPYDGELESLLADRGVAYRVQKTQGAAWAARRHQFDAIQRWYVHGWTRLDARLRSSIVEGIVVFLSLFDDNPAVHRALCPPRRAYLGNAGYRRAASARTDRCPARCRQDHRLELPGGDESRPGSNHRCDVEAGFQRAVLQRILQMAAQPQRIWRDLMFVCDEYDAFATVGETDPTGDERTFALSRQARLMPIVATQSISSLRWVLPGDESWRTFLQCFRTKVFLAPSDEFTARSAANTQGDLQRGVIRGFGVRQVKAVSCSNPVSKRRHP